MHSVLQHYTQTQIEKASGIKCIVTDVDGVLTDGGITYDNQGFEYKKFNAKDGLIVGFLRAAGFKVGAITGRSSAIVEGRSRELKFDFLYQDAKDKLEPFEEIKIKFNLTNQEIAYIGDDILDLPLIVQSGLGVAPADAHNYIPVSDQSDGIKRQGFEVHLQPWRHVQLAKPHARRSRSANSIWT